MQKHQQTKKPESQLTRGGTAAETGDEDRDSSESLRKAKGAAQGNKPTRNTRQK